MTYSSRAVRTVLAATLALSTLLAGGTLPSAAVTAPAASAESGDSTVKPTYRKPGSKQAINERIIYDFLRDEMELNDATACGVLANIWIECRFDPDANYTEKDGALSYGLCQWNKSRLENLKTFSAERGLNYRSIDAQLLYMKYELTEGGEKSAYRRMMNIPNTREGSYTAGYNWARYYERSANHTNRAELARDSFWPIYGRYADIGLNIPYVPVTDKLNPEAAAVAICEGYAKGYLGDDSRLLDAVISAGQAGFVYLPEPENPEPPMTSAESDPTLPVPPASSEGSDRTDPAGSENPGSAEELPDGSDTAEPAEPAAPVSIFATIDYDLELIFKTLHRGSPIIVLDTDSGRSSVIYGYNGDGALLESSGFTVMTPSQSPIADFSYESLESFLTYHPNVVFRVLGHDATELPVRNDGNRRLSVRNWLCPAHLPTGEDFPSSGYLLSAEPIRTVTLTVSSAEDPVFIASAAPGRTLFSLSELDGSGFATLPEGSYTITLTAVDEANVLLERTEAFTVGSMPISSVLIEDYADSVGAPLHPTEGIYRVAPRSGLHLRAEASTGSDSLLILPAETLVSVTELTESGWGKVSHEGQSGWIFMEYAEYVGPLPEPDTGCYRITATSGLRLRAEASTGSDILATIPNGTRLSITETSDGWGKTVYLGKTGWISLEYAEKVESESYLIDYQGSSAAGIPDIQTKVTGESIILSDAIPVRAGYLFLGWSTSSARLTIDYFPGDSYQKDADLTLYAVWKRADGEKLIGDINSDGRVNMKDLVLLRRALAGDALLIDDAMADLNRDGRVNEKDVDLLRQYLAGWAI